MYVQPANKNNIFIFFKNINKYTYIYTLNDFSTFIIKLQMKWNTHIINFDLLYIHKVMLPPSNYEERLISEPIHWKLFLFPKYHLQITYFNKSVPKNSIEKVQLKVLIINMEELNTITIYTIISGILSMDYLFKNLKRLCCSCR